MHRTLVPFSTKVQTLSLNHVISDTGWGSIPNSLGRKASSVVRMVLAMIQDVALQAQSIDTRLRPPWD